MSCMRADLPDEFTVGRFEPQQEASEALYLEREGPHLGADGGVFGGGWSRRRSYSPHVDPLDQSAASVVHEPDWLRLIACDADR